jgi:microcystin-dependent protein
MARDSNGNYSLPSGYKGTPGETILASQHNPPLEDLASAMTGSLPRDGSAPMGGPLRTVTGSAGSPAVYPNGNPAVGIHFANGKVNFVGSVAGLRYIGELIPYTFLTPEPLTVLPYGQTLLRASYPDLWAKAQTDIVAGNTFYNNGDGSTTFGIGDMRGRVPAGKDNMGGSAAGRLTTAGSGVNGAVLGAAGGGETVTLTAPQLPIITPTFTGNNGSITVTSRATNVVHGLGFVQGQSGGSFGSIVSTPSLLQVTSDGSFTPTGSVSSFGSGAAHNNTQSTLVCNYLLYVGA